LGWESIFPRCPEVSNLRCRAGAIVFREFFDEKVAFAGCIFFVLFTGDTDAIASFDIGYVSNQHVGLPVSFVLEREAAWTGHSAAGDGGRPADEVVDADSDGGSDETDGYACFDSVVLELVGVGRFWEKQERGTEQNSCEFMAQ
jgi:hypothetical protein